MTKSKEKFTRSDIASFLAVLLSIAALAIGIVEAQIMSEQQEIMAQQQEVMVEQQKGSVWPYVEVKNNISIKDSLLFTITAENKGVGPAIVSELSIQVKDQFYSTFNDFTAAMDSIIGKGNYQPLSFGISQSSRSVYKPGEKKILFSISIQDQDAFFKKIGSFNISLKYCSIYGDCWKENGQTIQE